RAGQGRRAAHVPERSDLRREEGRPHRVPRPEGDAVDRDAGRAHEDWVDEARGEGLLQVPLVGDRPARVRRPGLPAGRQERGEELPPLPPAGVVYDPLGEAGPERLAEGEPALLQSEDRGHGEDRSVAWPLAPPPSSGRFASAPAGRGRPPAWW